MGKNKQTNNSHAKLLTAILCIHNYLHQCNYINRLIYHIDKIYITTVFFFQLSQIREFSQNKYKRLWACHTVVNFFFCQEKILTLKIQLQVEQI